MKLTDVDALLTQMKKYHKTRDEEANMTGDRAVCATWDDAVILVKNAPTVDAEPVRHGKWIPHTEKSREYIGTVLINAEYYYWLCNTCGYRVKKGQPMYNYCPNCGAKMDSERKEE